MTDFFKNHRKKTIFVTFLFLLFFGGWWSVKYNLPKTVEVVVKLFVGPTFKSSSITFEKNRVVIKDFILADGDEVIIDTPQVDILYSEESLKKFRIEEIIVNGGTANITRRKNGDINIVAAFTGESEPSEDKTEETPQEDKPYEPGIGIPIDKITGIGVTTVYRDQGYRLPIEQTAYNTNGYLTFSKTTGIDLHFIGSNQEEIYDFAFSTAKEPYSMTIKLSNIGVKTELVQYGYDGKEVSYQGGKLNMDLTIASSGMLGWIDFKDVDVRYIDLDDTIEKVQGRVDFKSEGIFLNAKGKVFGKDEKFTLSYANNELNIDFNLKNIKQESLEKLSYLNGVELPFKNLNVDSVKFNLNLKKELKVTIDTFIKKANLEGMKLEDTEVKFLYDSKGIHLPVISTNLSSVDKNGEVGIKEKIVGALDFGDKKGELTFNVKNINEKDFIPNIEGNLLFDIKEKEVALVFNSNIVNLEGRYLTEEKRFQLDKKDNYYLSYDIQNKKLEDGKGIIDFSIFTFDFSLDYLIENSKLTINSFSLNDKNREILNLKGEIDLLNFVYNLHLATEDFDINRKINDQELNAKIKLFGKIEGEKDRFKSNIDIGSLTVKYMGELENLKGKIVLAKEKDLYFEYNGEIDKLSYKDLSLNGIGVSARLKDGIFQIRDFQNQLFSLSGEYSLIDSTVRGRLETRNLPLERFGVDFPKIGLNKVVGEIRGEISDPNINVKISDVEIGFKNDEKIKIVGDLNFKKGVLTTNNLKINQSLLRGDYSIKDGSYTAKLNIIEENIGRYYDYESLKYRVIGVLTVNGKEGDLKAQLKSTVDKIYLNGNVFPTAYVEVEYGAKNFTDGVVNLKEIVLNNRDFENLITLKGTYEVPTKFLDVKIVNEELPLTKLRDYIPLEDIQGKLNIGGGVKGEISSLLYDLSVKSDLLNIKNINFENLKLKLKGDLSKLTLEEFSFDYLGNNFTSRGYYELASGKYNYRANSKKIDLKFLNPFLEKSGFTILSGEGAINVRLQENENKGFLKIKDLSFENKDLYLKLQEFNSNIRLDGNSINIKKFNGKLNDGLVELDGKVTFPGLKEISENPYYYENIKYDGNLKLNSIKYKYGDYFSLEFGADIGIHNKEVRGIIDIKNGEVREIPNTSKSIFQKLREFLFSSTSNTVNQSEDLGSDFKLETIIENAPVLDIQVKIEEGIKLDIDNITPFVEDIKGNVIGNGILSGKDGKYTFIGNSEVIGGSLNINDNTFYLDRAIVVFNDMKTYLPKVNPNLLVDARVNVQDEQIGLSLNGVLSNLQFTISSKNGSSSGNLNSLLTDSEEIGENSEATTTLITNVIGGQLTQIIKPVSNLVKNALNISKFRISSNLLTQESKNTNNSQEKAQSTLKLGAVLEAEDNIYKDKIWWVAKGTLLEEDNTESSKREDSSGALKEYDFSLEYRFDTTKSIGIGVGKLPEERKKTSDKESKGNLNYHIDFKFEKKYDKLIDIFINN